MNSRRSIFSFPNLLKLQTLNGRYQSPQVLLLVPAGLWQPYLTPEVFRGVQTHQIRVYMDFELILRERCNFLSHKEYYSLKLQKYGCPKMSFWVLSGSRNTSKTPNLSSCGLEVVLEALFWRWIFEDFSTKCKEKQRKPRGNAMIWTKIQMKWSGLQKT